MSMTREEAIKKLESLKISLPAAKDEISGIINLIETPWIKFTEKFPSQQEPIIIAMKNKNKEDGIWLYDLCMFFGGDYTDNNNWEEKINWEIPIYWMPIPELPK